MSFNDLTLPEFKNYFAEYNFKKATKTQSVSFQPILNRLSVHILAPTGTGKTLAYLLPLFDNLKANDTGESVGPRAIILTPTRELSSQVFRETKKVSHHVKLRVRKLMGGVPKSNINDADIIITTMKCLTDNIKKKRISTKSLEMVVFDEADQMFDGGFEKESESFLNLASKLDVQLLFFSATHSFNLDAALKNLGTDIKSFVLDETSKVQQQIQTINFNIDPKSKLLTLKGIIKKELKTKTICFFNKKEVAGEFYQAISTELTDKRIFLVHGGLLKKERDAALDGFRKSKKGILFASDVMARGIDITDLDVVINVSLPKTSIYYLHRIGRVGRAKKEGTVINFVTHRDEKLIAGINVAIKEQSILKVSPIKVSKKKVIKAREPKMNKKVT